MTKIVAKNKGTKNKEKKNQNKKQQTKTKQEKHRKWHRVTDMQGSSDTRFITFTLH